MYTGVHLNVSWESYLFEFFDLKSVPWQLINCIYSETYMIYMWISILHQLVHVYESVTY